MSFFLKILVVAIVLVALVMGVFGLKLLSDKGAKFDVDADPEKYKKSREKGIYSAYKEENKRKDEA
mgnify:CR=1 FL=1